VGFIFIIKIKGSNPQEPFVAFPTPLKKLMTGEIVDHAYAVLDETYI
jgi:hypothetical protein